MVSRLTLGKGKKLVISRKFQRCEGVVFFSKTSFCNSFSHLTSNCYAIIAEESVYKTMEICIFKHSSILFELIEVVVFEVCVFKYLRFPQNIFRVALLT